MSNFLEQNALDIGKTLAGAGLIATGFGGPVGASLLASGVGGITSNVLTPQEEQERLTVPSTGPLLSYADGGEISTYNGGNGKRDSISLGDVAMVDDGEVRMGDYIFSNKLKQKGITFANQVKDVLTRNGWNEKEGKFLRPFDEATRNSIEKEIEPIKEAQETIRVKKAMTAMDKLQTEFGDMIPAFQNGGIFDPRRSDREFIGSRDVFGEDRDINLEEREGFALAPLFNEEREGVGSRIDTTTGAPPIREEFAQAFAVDDSVPADPTREFASTGIPQNVIGPYGVIGSALPAVGNLIQALGPAEREEFERVQLDPTLMDLSAAERDVRRQGDIATSLAQRNIREASRGAGSYLSNIAAATSDIRSNVGNALANLQAREQQANTQILNNTEREMAIRNQRISQQEDIANAQNRAARMSALSNALAGIGSGIAGYGRDRAMAEAENIRNRFGVGAINAMSQRYRYNPNTNTIEFVG